MLRLTAAVLFFCLSLCVAAQERRWFVAGRFDKLSGRNKTIAANNIAYTLDGQAWAALGEGTNGQINAVYVDACQNVYIGGEFTKAGGVDTGPVAAWWFGADNWAPLGAPLARTAGSTSQPVVHSITVDCVGGCDACRVYVGGAFGFALADGTEATAVAAFDNKTLTWSNLGGTAQHMLDADDAVYVVAKQERGIKQTMDRLWVGGRFPGALKYLVVPSNKWYDVPNSPNMFNDTVNAIAYNGATLTDAFVFVGGRYTAVSDTTDRNLCSNLCKFDTVNGDWTPVLEQYDGHVAALAVTDTYVYFGGDLVNGDNNRINLGAVPLPLGQAKTLIPAPSVAPSEPVASLFACDATDKMCSSGYVGVVGAAGNLKKFYDDAAQVWTDMAVQFATNGGAAPVVRSLTSAYYDPKGVPPPQKEHEPRSVAKRVVGIIFIVIVLVLLLIVFTSLGYERYQKRKKLLRELNEQQMREAEL